MSDQPTVLSFDNKNVRAERLAKKKLAFVREFVMNRVRGNITAVDSAQAVDSACKAWDAIVAQPDLLKALEAEE